MTFFILCVVLLFNWFVLTENRKEDLVAQRNQLNIRWSILTNKKVYCFLFNAVFVSHHHVKRTSFCTWRSFTFTMSVCFTWCLHPFVGCTLKRSLLFKIQSCFTMNALWPLTFCSWPCWKCSLLYWPHIWFQQVDSGMGRKSRRMDRERESARHTKGRALSARCDHTHSSQVCAFSLARSFTMPGPCLR